MRLAAPVGGGKVHSARRFVDEPAVTEHALVAAASGSLLANERRPLLGEDHVPWLGAVTARLPRANPFTPLSDVDRDVFGLPPLAGPIPESVLAGLGQLAAAPPIWGDNSQWLELVDRLRAFSMRWHSPSAAIGWTAEQLYGLDSDAPYTRVGRMGAAFLACLREHRVIAVDAVAVRVVASTAARLSIYRPEGGAVLAWKLDEVL